MYQLDLRLRKTPTITHSGVEGRMVEDDQRDVGLFCSVISWEGGNDGMKEIKFSWKKKPNWMCCGSWRRPVNWTNWS